MTNVAYFTPAPMLAQYSGKDLLQILDQNPHEAANILAELRRRIEDGRLIENNIKKIIESGACSHDKWWNGLPEPKQEEFARHYFEREVGHSKFIDDWMPGWVDQFDTEALLLIIAQLTKKFL